jgi:predicted GNAT family acetyltransferase
MTDGSDPARSAEVVDNKEQSRFELDLERGMALAYYKRDGNTVTLLHTEVPQELSGHGIGSRLAGAVFEALRRDGAQVVAKCPFMAAYGARRPEYADMLVG